MPPPAFGPPNEVLARLAGALFPGFSTLCRPRACCRLHRDKCPTALKGFPVAGRLAGVGGGVCCLLGHWGSIQQGCGDTFTQAPEGQARPSTGPTTEGPARTVPSSELASAPARATGPFCVLGRMRPPRFSPSSLPGSSSLLLKVLD